MSLLAALNPLNSILKPLVGAYNKRQEIKDNAHARRTDLINSTEDRNHTWELAALEGESWELGVIRMGIYLEVSVAVLITVIDPAKGAEIWEALATVPEWIIGLHLTIAGWGFGSTPIKNAAAGMVGMVIGKGK